MSKQRIVSQQNTDSRDQEKILARVLHAVESIRQGGMVILVDDEDRENEGDIVFAAEHVSAEKINFMAKEARGLICLPMSSQMLDKLELSDMKGLGHAKASRTTAFTVSIEAKDGVTTGISAHDRAHTIKVAIDDASGPKDIVVPGHIFPLRARSGGVLERAGHTEGTVDLCLLAGLKPAGVLCEIMNDDGSMARMPELKDFSKKHNLPILTVEDLITFRLLKDSLVEKKSLEVFETNDGALSGVIFESNIDQSQHFALVKGYPFKDDDIVDVRVQNQAILSDVFGQYISNKSSKNKMGYSLSLFGKNDKVCLLYLVYPFFGKKLEEDFKRLLHSSSQKAESKAARQDEDLRMLGIGAQILRQLGVKNMRLHMSTPRPLKGLAGFGLEVKEVVTIPT